MDLLLVKKTLSYLVYPYSLALVLLAAGLALSWGRRAPLTGRVRAGRVGVGRVLAVLGLALLVSQSMPLVPNTLARKMQEGYPALVKDEDIPRDAKWVVVLSGASSDDHTVPVSSRNVGDSLHRVVEGVVLAWRIPGARLLLSGGSVYGEGAAARVMAEMARELKFPEERLVLEEASRDTEDQARLVAGMVGRDKVVLVTSVRHMPRSMMLFRRYGVDAVAAPVALPVKSGEFSLLSLLPNPRAAATTASLAHEIMGMVWIWVKGVVR